MRRAGSGIPPIYLFIFKIYIFILESGGGTEREGSRENLQADSALSTETMEVSIPQPHDPKNMTKAETKSQDS